MINNPTQTTSASIEVRTMKLSWDKVYKHLQLTVLFLCLAVNAFAQPVVNWAAKTGGAGNDVGLGVGHDSQGNVYVTGYFTGTVTYGSTTLTSSGSNDIFLLKYDANGSIVWAKKAGGSADDQGLGLCVDINGNVIISGIVASTNAQFEGIAVATVGSYDVFVAKYDSNGNIIWVRTGGGTNQDYGWSVGCDNSGNVYVGGSILSTSATFGTTTFTRSGAYDVFVVKYDANGNFIQVKSAGGVGEDIAYSIAVHPDGICLYVTGRFAGTATFGSQTVTSSGGNDIFVAGFDFDTGTWKWVRKAGGTGSDTGQGAATDDSCNVYITGQFSSATVNFSGSTLTSAGSSDIFIAKYNEQGDLKWVKKAGGTGADYGSGISVDAARNIYVTGYISGTASFGTTSLTSNGGIDIFAARYKADATLDYAVSYGGTGSEYGRVISSDNQGNAYITGPFQNTVNFGGTTLTSTGGQDVYVMKLGAAIPASITVQPLTNNTYTAGDALQINFTTTGTFNTGNVFTAQLSDENGNFSTSVPIGTLASISSGSINCGIPILTGEGSGYRIRLVSSNPTIIGGDNGSNLKINISSIVVKDNTDNVWQSGMIYLKIKDNSNVDLSDYPNIPLDVNNSLYNIMNSYNVIKVEKPFVILNNIRFDRTYRISFDQTHSADDFIAELNSVNFIEYSEKIPVVSSHSVSNDPVQPYYLNLINSNGASNIHISTGSAVVAIIDDAILTTHEDLAANIGSNNRDVADLDNDPNPPLTGSAAVGVNPYFSHGTNVAGLAGGVTNNNVGIASIGWNNRIMCIKSRKDNDISTNIPYWADGVAWATANGANVINMSFGGSGASQTDFNVIKTARDMNIILVASAGNNSTSLANYPAAYGENMTGQAWETSDKTMVIAVASLDANNNRSGFSNFGSWVDIAAYGSDIMTTKASSSSGYPINNLYDYESGTSMAAPIVSGIAGIMRSYNSAATVTDIYNCLRYTSNSDIYNSSSHPNNYPDMLGSGRIDAEAALRCLGVGCNNPIAVIIPSSQRICPNSTVDLTVNQGISYLWSTGETTSSITVNQSGIYSVTVTFSGGCTATTAFNLQDADLTAHIVLNENSGLYANDGIVCGYNTVVISSYSGLSYLWNWGYTTPAIPGSVGTNIFPNTITVSVQIGGVGGCAGIVSTAYASFTAIPVPNVVVSPSSPHICLGESITLTASGADTYSWLYINSTNNSIQVSPSVTTNYSVMGTETSTGCTSTFPTIATVTVDPLPTISGTLTACIGTTTTLTGSGTPNAATPWVSSNTAVATVSATGVVTGISAGTSVITYMNTDDCSQTATVTIITTPTFSFDANTACINGGTGTVFTSSAADTYHWNFGDAASTSNTSTIQNPTHLFTETGTFVVKLTATNSCGTKTSSQAVQVVDNCCALTAAYDVTDANKITIGDGTTLTTTNWAGSLPYGSGTEMKISNVITIKDKATLTISGAVTLRFGPFGKVIVEPGGKLNITNGVLLTSLGGSCDQMWQGIEVWGNSAKTQSKTDAPFQGFLKITSNVLIENAHIGVLAGRPDDCVKLTPQHLCLNTPFLYNYGGGVVTITGATFKNNGIGVRFTNYTTAQSISYVRSSTFITNGTLLDAKYRITSSSTDYYGSADPHNPKHYGFANAGRRTCAAIYVDSHLWASANANSSATFFGNVITNTENGIRAFDSRFTAYQNVLDRVSYGIGLYHTTSNLQFSHYVVQNTVNNTASFNNAMISAIEITAGRNEVVKLNSIKTISTASSQNWNIYGIKLFNTSGFTILDNNINQVFYGLVCDNSSTGGGIIGFETNGNTFSDNNYGIQAFNNNGSLNLKCNNHTNPNTSLTNPNYRNIYSENVLAQQGIYSATNNSVQAGNKFNTTGAKLIQSNSSASVTYHYQQTSSGNVVLPNLTMPGGQINSFIAYPSPVTFDANSCKPYTFCYGCGRTIDQYTADISALQTELQTAQSSVDGGSGGTLRLVNTNKHPAIENTTAKTSNTNVTTASLLAHINNATNAWGNLKNELIQASPLSDTVLITLINHTPAVPPGILKDILLLNLPASERVWTVLYAKLSSLPNGIAMQLSNAQAYNPGVRTPAGIEADIAYNEGQQQIYFNQAITYYTDSNYTDSLKLLLMSEGTNFAQEMLFGIALSESNYTDAANFLANYVPTTADESNWKALMQYELNLQQGGLSYYESDATQIDMLRNLAILPGGSTATANARAILLLLFDERYTDNFTGLRLVNAAESGTEEVWVAEEKNTTTDVGSPALGNNTPNPFNRSTVIPYYIPVKNEAVKAEIKIYDLRGVLINSIHVKEGFGTITFEKGDLSEGVYLYNLEIDGMIVDNKRMVILK